MNTRGDEPPERYEYDVQRITMGDRWWWEINSAALPPFRESVTTAGGSGRALIGRFAEALEQALREEGFQQAKTSIGEEMMTRRLTIAVSGYADGEPGRVGLNHAITRLLGQPQPWQAT